MARLQIVLKDETEHKLRESIFKTKGTFKKGDISEAVEEAIELWIQEQMKKDQKAKKDK